MFLPLSSRSDRNIEHDEKGALIFIIARDDVTWLLSSSRPFFPYWRDYFHYFADEEKDEKETDECDGQVPLREGSFQNGISGCEPVQETLKRSLVQGVKFWE